VSALASTPLHPPCTNSQEIKPQGQLAIELSGLVKRKSTSISEKHGKQSQVEKKNGDMATPAVATLSSGIYSKNTHTYWKINTFTVITCTPHTLMVG